MGQKETIPLIQPKTHLRSTRPKTPPLPSDSKIHVKSPKCKIFHVPIYQTTHFQKLDIPPERKRKLEILYQDITCNLCNTNQTENHIHVLLNCPALCPSPHETLQSILKLISRFFPYLNNIQQITNIKFIPKNSKEEVIAILIGIIPAQIEALIETDPIKGNQLWASLKKTILDYISSRWLKRKELLSSTLKKQKQHHTP